MAQGPQGVKPLGFAALRPVLVGALLVVDAAMVIVLVLLRHKGWFPPFVGFGMVLLGLIWLMGWSLRHRHDDDPES